MITLPQISFPQDCFQNKYGIMPLRQHGGSYPYASFNSQGNTKVNDYCMAVGVMLRGSTADGWYQNANGSTVPTAILIGPTDATITSPLALSCGLSEALNRAFGFE